MIKDSEEQWSTVLQTAENTLKKVEVQYSLSKELEAFRTQAGSTKTWVKELQEQADSKGKGTQGSQAQIKDRLDTAQVQFIKIYKLYPNIPCFLLYFSNGKCLTFEQIVRQM